MSEKKTELAGFTPSFKYEIKQSKLDADADRRLTATGRKWSSSGMDLTRGEAEARRMEKRGTFAAVSSHGVDQDREGSEAARGA